MRRIWLVFRKDLVLELAGMRIVPTMMILAVLILLIFVFARGQSVQDSSEAAALLAIAFVFCGVVASERCFETENRGGTLEAMRQITGETDFMFWGKFLWVLLLLFFAEFWSCLVFSVLFNYSLHAYIYQLIIILALFNIGFAAMSVLFSALTYSSRGKGFLLVIVLLPLLIPPVLGVVLSLRSILNGAELSFVTHWLKFLAGFDLVFGALSVLLFERAIES
jgi:heme exporter protein B